MSLDLKRLDTLAGRAYIGALALPASASNYSHLELWNPAASGKLLVVTGCFVSTAAAVEVQGRVHTVGLGIIQTPGPLTKLIPTGAASVAELRTNQQASLAGALGDVFFNAYLAADDRFPVPLDGPLVVEEGRGLIFVPMSVNVALRAGVGWQEIDA